MLILILSTIVTNIENSTHQVYHCTTAHEKLGVGSIMIYLHAVTFYISILHPILLSFCAFTTREAARALAGVTKLSGIN